MRPLDLVVILIYLVAIAAVGLRLSGRRQSATAYFAGERDLPWWAVCFSIMATETSTFLLGLSCVEPTSARQLPRSLPPWW